MKRLNQNLQETFDYILKHPSLPKIKLKAKS